MSARLKSEAQSHSAKNPEKTNGLTEEQVKQLLAAAGRRKDDPDYLERLVEGAAEYRRLLQDQESLDVQRVDK